MIKFLSSFLLFVCLFSLSCKEKENLTLGGKGGKTGGGPIKVEGMVITGTKLQPSLTLSGTLLPFESTEIRSEISGRVTNLNIKEGETVAKGSLLVKIFDADLQAQLKKLNVQLQITEKTEERQRELLKIGGIAQQDYDLSVLQLSNIKADIELVKVNISKTEIRAPYSGKLGLKSISLGAYLSPTTLITTITQTDKMKLIFNVPEKYGANIKTHQTIVFSVDGYDKKFTANVLAKESAIDESTRNLKILALVQGKDNALIPGSFVKISLELAANNAAMMIPTYAIIPQARNKMVATYQNGVAVMKKVTTGIRESGNVEILTGLNIGDTIITTGLLFVKPDSKIKLSKIN
jgi:membrane fusion protein, multidrug efflux system